MSERDERTRRRLRRLHDEVDAAVLPLTRLHRDRLVCRRGCASCCVDGITVFEIEAERIRAAHGDLLATGAAHPPGGCAFLDDAGACRIYADRPYVCRTQGLPLRWMDRDEHGGDVEYRDVCPLNEREEEPVESLPAQACFTLGPFEARLAMAQARRDRTAPRVSLRALFERGG